CVCIWFGLVLFALYTCCVVITVFFFFFFSSRRRHTRSKRDWSSDVCSSDLAHFSILFKLEKCAVDYCNTCNILLNMMLINQGMYRMSFQKNMQVARYWTWVYIH